MHLFKKSVLLTVLILFLFISMSWAVEEKNKKQETPEQENPYEVKKEEVVVVTATMTPKALKDLPTSVEVLEQKDIRLSSSSSALNILNQFPGIFVNRSGDFGRADVDIRGLGQNCRRVAILVDGKPEKMALYGCAVSHAFPLDNVERVELVKGPASVLYGGEALGGAINIITRMPEKRFETEFTAFYGSYNTSQINVTHGGNLDQFKYFVTFDRRESDGHVDNADYSGYSVTGKVAYDFSDSLAVRVQAKYFDGKKYEPGTIDAPLVDFWNDYERGSVDVTLDKKIRNNHLQLKLYRNFGKHQFSDGFDSIDHTDGAALRYTFRQIPNNELTIGGDLRYFGGTSYNYPVGKWDKHEGSLFLQNETIFDTRWILSAGMRLQMDSLYGSEFCPRIGLVFQPGHTTSLRAVVSKGFRSPQINELYMYPSANPDLEPERVWNYEIGFDQKIGSRLTVRGSLFHMKGDNLILTIANASPPPMYIFANSGEFSFYGAEVEVETVINKYFSGTVSYAYMDYEDYTKGRPGQKADFSLVFKKKRLTANIRGQYIADYYADDYSRAKIPAYFLLNARIIFALSDNLELLLDANNILDEDYSIYGEFPGMTAGLYRMPGRNFQVGIRYSPFTAH